MVGDRSEGTYWEFDRVSDFAVSYTQVIFDRTQLLHGLSRLQRNLRLLQRVHELDQVTTSRDEEDVIYPHRNAFTSTICIGNHDV